MRRIQVDNFHVCPGKNKSSFCMAEVFVWSSKKSQKRVLLNQYCQPAPSNINDKEMQG